MQNKMFLKLTTTKNKYPMASNPLTFNVFNPLMMVRKGHRCLNKMLQVKFTGWFSTLLLPPGIGWSTELILCKVYRVNNLLQRFEKKQYR